MTSHWSFHLHFPYGKCWTSLYVLFCHLYILHWDFYSCLSEWVSEVAQSCPTLCNPMDCSLQGSSVHGIFQATVLKWIAISFSRGSSQPRDWTWVSRIVGRRFTIWTTREGVLFQDHHIAWQIPQGVFASFFFLKYLLMPPCMFVNRAIKGL